MSLTTTVIGSHPYARMEPEDAIKRAVEDQISAGIDYISDGQVRADMVGLFAAGIPGYNVEGRKYNVIGKISPADRALAIDDLTLAKKFADGRAKVKGIITGPTTMAHCSILQEGAPYKPHDMPEGAQSMVVDEALIMDVAAVLAQEAKFLTEAGFDVIQIDEPFFSMPDLDVELGLKAIAIVAESINCSALHVCGDITPIMAQLMDASVDIIEVEGQHAVTLDWLTPEMMAEKKKKIAWGVISVNSNDVEEPDEIEARIQAGVDKIGVDNMWVSPDCGMRVRKPEVAKQKLDRMVAAARKVAS